MPVHTTRATRMETTAKASPPSARGATPNNPTSTAKPACKPTMSPIRARPCAMLAQTKLTTFESAGAPLTNPTARLTIHGSAACANVFLMRTAAVAPSTRPSVRPSRAHEAISRRKAASAVSESAGRSTISAALSTEALPDQPVERPDGVRIGSDRPARPFLGVPGIDIAVQPVARPRDESFQEQRGDDRPGELRRRHIIKVGHAAREILVIAGPQRHGPHRVGLALAHQAKLLAQLRRR